jgi:hypothetical protein
MEERTLPKDERALMLSSSISVSDRSGVYIAEGEDGRVGGGSKVEEQGAAEFNKNGRKSMKKCFSV